MKHNHRRVVTGLVAAGLVTGALAAGGVALASAGAPTQAASASAALSYGPGTAWFGGRCGMYGMGGMWSGQQPVMKAAADYLGLSLTQLQARLRPGTSLADIAQAQGRPVAGLKNALLAAMTSRVNASTTLTAEQKTAMISHVRSHLDTMIDMDMDMGMPHSPGTGMGGMGPHMSGTGSPMGGMWR